MLSDPIADMLTRIKNGYQARKDVVLLPWSKIKEEIGQILLKEGYLKDMKSKGTKAKDKVLELELKYEGRKPALNEIKRISKPGLRIYAKVTKIPRVRFGFGITIVSTPKGLMIGKEAKKKKLGGEIICQIW